MFYVDANNTIQGLYNTLSTPNTNFTKHLVSSQNLQTSDDLFIRTCVTSFTDVYATMYLYYLGREGVVRKYVFNTVYEGLNEMYDLPDLTGAREVECQFAGGMETLWTLNNASRLTSWYRDANIKGDWNQGRSQLCENFENSTYIVI